MNQKTKTKDIWAARGLLAASILAAGGGIAAFILLFIPDYNIYWFMLTPIILAFYFAPAAFLFRRYRRKMRAISGQDSDTVEKEENSTVNCGDH